MKISKISKMKYLFIALILLLLLYILFSSIAEFYTVIETVPDRTTPPEGYSTGVCNSPDFYDWTQGNYLILPVDAPGVVTEMDRYRSREAPDLSACIPNTWEVTSIPNLREKMKSFASK